MDQPESRSALLVCPQGGHVLQMLTLPRARALSLSGRLVYPLASVFFVQWPRAAGWRRRAKHAGNLL